MKNIHDLNLHDTLIISPTVSIIRVPGGWIYTIKTYGGDKSSVFVPYVNEFKESLNDENLPF